MRACVLGVDFSGGRQAERKVWIAQARLRGFVLNVETLASAETLFSVRGPFETCRALCDHIVRAGSCVVGIDAPFGLARASVASPDWPSLLREVASTADADAFRRDFGAPERRRATDIEAKTPFAPTNLRLYRQTYFAMAHLAAPLVASDGARFPPMQKVDAAKPIVIETCPASRLKRLGLYGAPYKGAGDERRRMRAAMLAAFQSQGVRLAACVIDRALEDAEGDALDAVVCCVIAADAGRAEAHGSTPAEPENVEGRVFF